MNGSRRQWTVIFLTALVTAFVVGGALYLWQSSTREDEGGTALQVESLLHEQILALEDQVAELKLQVEALEHENESLKTRGAPLSESAIEVENGEDSRTYKELAPELSSKTAAVSQKPRSGWEVFFPDHGTTTLVDKHVGEVEKVLGPPPFLVRSTAVNPRFNREVWIFLPYDEDPTGLYVYFKGDRVHKSRLDEFNGLPGSTIFSDHEFWYN